MTASTGCVTASQAIGEVHPLVAFAQLCYQAQKLPWPALNRQHVHSILLVVTHQG